MISFSSKQSGEQYYLGFDFSLVIGVATIVTPVVTVYDPDDSDVTSTLINAAKQSVSGNIVYFWIRSGTSGTTYKITCSITTSDASVYEYDAEIDVLDI